MGNHKVLFDGNGSSRIFVFGFGQYVPIRELIEVETERKVLEKQKADTERRADQLADDLDSILDAFENGTDEDVLQAVGRVLDSRIEKGGA